MIGPQKHGHELREENRQIKFKKTKIKKIKERSPDTLRKSEKRNGFVKGVKKMKKRAYMLAVLATATVAAGLSACGAKTETTTIAAASSQAQGSQAEIKIANDNKNQTAAATEAASSEAESAESAESTEQTEKVLEQSPKTDAVQTTATAPAAAYPDEYQDYAGTWVNTESERCSMNIRSNGNGTYAISINWSDSAWQHYEWTMTGTPSKTRRGGGLDYTDGTRTLVSYTDDGKETRKVEATGEKGNFFVNESRILTWKDPNENQGEAVEFCEAGAEFSADDSYLIPNSDNHIVTDAELSGMTKDTLRLARNEIYARHGLQFKDQELQSYFNGKSWYSPTIPAGQFDEKMLNSYEKENLKILLNKENSK